MPFANLIIAQAAAGWLAPTALIAFVVALAPAVTPWAFFLMIALVAVIVWFGGFIGARISSALPQATIGSLAACFVAAIVGALLSIAVIAPNAEGSEALTHLTTFAPVAAAIAAYFVASPRRA